MLIPLTQSPIDCSFQETLQKKKDTRYQSSFLIFFSLDESITLKSSIAAQGTPLRRNERIKTFQKSHHLLSIKTPMHEDNDNF